MIPNRSDAGPLLSPSDQIGMLLAVFQTSWRCIFDYFAVFFVAVISADERMSRIVSLIYQAAGIWAAVLAHRGGRGA